MELLEKRMAIVKKQTEQIASLEESLQKSQAQEHMYAEAIENLQAEYDALEQENARLKKAAAQKEEQRQAAPPKQPEYEAPEDGATKTAEAVGNCNEVAGQVNEI